MNIALVCDRLDDHPVRAGFSTRRLAEALARDERIDHITVLCASADPACAHEAYAIDAIHGFSDERHVDDAVHTHAIRWLDGFDASLSLSCVAPGDAWLPMPVTRAPLARHRSRYGTYLGTKVWFGHDRPRQKLLRATQEIVRARTVQRLALTNAHAAAMSSLLGVPPSLIARVRAHDLLTPESRTTSQRAAIRRALDLRNEDRVVLCALSLARMPHSERTLRAFAHATTRMGQPPVLVITGLAGVRFLHRAAAFGIEAHVRCVGETHDPLALLHACDALIATPEAASKHDDWLIPAASAAQMPVITASDGAHGPTGIELVRDP
ncbi:MAG: hypothetical protein AAGD00_00005, partial [Planctomycetota bacterium]